MTRQTITYGLVVFAAVLFVGWSTGMGGSPLPNLLFSVAMGVLASGCYWAVQKISRKSGGGGQE